MSFENVSVFQPFDHHWFDAVAATEVKTLRHYEYNIVISRLS